MTIDDQGDIFVIDQECHSSEPAVLEYRPNGEFVRAISGSETPGIGVGHDEGGWGGRPQGLAFDPVSNHLIVSIKGAGPAEGVGAVDEFDAATGGYLAQIANSSEGTPLGNPLQMTVDSQGDLYLVDRQNAAIDVYGPGRLLANLNLQGSEPRFPDVVLKGSVQPEGLKLTSCEFQYLTEEAFKHNVEEHGGRESEGFADLSSGGEILCLPAPSSIVPNHTYQPVQAEVKGLASGTTYRYRLLAANEEPPGGTGTSNALAFTAPHAPHIEATTATNLSSTFADLRARINPLGADTTYFFQYVDEADFNSSGYERAQATPETDIGSGGPSGSAVEGAVQHIGGLSPGTTYVFRAVANNEAGTEIGATVTFATLPAIVPGLPDNRAYELLTPPNKGSAADMFANPSNQNEFLNNDVGFAAQSGDAFLLTTRSAFGPSPGSEGNAYVFSRAAGAWGYRSMTSSSLGLQEIVRPLFDPVSFSTVALEDNVGSEAGATGGVQDTSLVGSPGGPYTTLHVDPPFRFGTGESAREETQIVGASHDLGHLVLQSRDHTLAPGAEAQDEGSAALYEWSGGGECGVGKPGCRLVNADNEGKLLDPCGATLGQDTGNLQAAGLGAAHGAVSNDGSKIFFTAPDPRHPVEPADKTSAKGCWNQEKNEDPPQLYMRSAGRTVQLSAPEVGVSEAGHPPVQYPVAYVGASEDGSRVFFVTETWLTANHPEGHDLELYEYDTETARLIRLSAGQSPATAANLWKVEAVSASGSAVYFTAFGALAPGGQALAPATSFEPTPVNVYRYDTASGTTTYIAPVLTSEEPTGASVWFSQIVGIDRSVAPNPETSWYTTPDGRFLLFPTQVEIKPHYSTEGGAICPPQRNGSSGRNGHCEELYRYDAQRPVSEGNPAVQDNPLCVSCNPSGVPPVSDAQFSRSAPTESGAYGPVRAISNDGSYVFFDTADALVPQDANSTLDVYEWHEGRISLISSGEDPAPSYFLGVSPDGANVFFGTHANLVPQDTDAAGDIYDASICTQTDPCVKPPAGETAQCEGDACQSPPPPPIDSTPVTLTPSGVGNLTPEVKPSPAPAKKCKKGFVKKKIKKKEKCIKKAKPKKRAKKASHKRRAK